MYFTYCQLWLVVVISAFKKDFVHMHLTLVTDDILFGLNDEQGVLMCICRKDFIKKEKIVWDKTEHLLRH